MIKIIPKKFNIFSNFFFIPKVFLEYVEILKFFIRTSYYSANLFSVIALVISSAMAGFMPQYFMIFWTVFQNSLTGSSKEAFFSIAKHICVQSIIYNSITKFIDFIKSRIACYQSYVVQDSFLNKVSKDINKLDTKTSLSQDVCTNIEKFYESNLDLLKKCTEDCTKTIGSFITLFRFGMLKIGFIFFSAVFVSDILIFMLSYYLAKEKESLNSMSSKIRDRLALIYEDNNKKIFQGQKSRFICYIEFLTEKLKKYQSIKIKSINKEKLIAYLNAILNGQIQPLCAILIVISLSPAFPLSSTLNNSIGNVGLTFGIFTQLISCFRHLWNSGSVVKNNYKSLSDLQSSFNPLKKTLDHFNFKERDCKASIKVNITSGLVFLRNIIFICITVILMKLFFYIAIYNSFVSIPDTIVFSPSYLTLLTILGLASYTLSRFYNNYKDNIGINFFSGISAFALSIIVNIFSNNVFILSAYGSAVLFYTVFCVSSIILGHLAQKLEKNNTKIANNVCFEENISYKFTNKVTRACEIRFSNISSGKNMPSLNNSSIVLKGGSIYCIKGENNTGKSSLIMESFSRSSTNESRLNGNISTPYGIKITFKQETLQNLDLYNEKYTIDNENLSDLKKVFYTLTKYACDDEKTNDKVYQEIKKNWEKYKQNILRFLEDKQISFDDRWIRQIRDSEKVDYNMSGGSTDKFMAAIINSIFSIGDNIADLNIAIAADECFTGVSKEIYTMLIKKIKCKVEERNKNIFIAVSHEDHQYLKEMFTCIEIKREDNKVSLTSL